MTPLPTILVADDTSTNLELMDSILGSDHEILVATHGQEAIELARAELPDLILMDVMMPGMDGYEACRQLKADACTSHIPVLFLTALADMDALVKGFEAGGVDFVTKPFRPEELQARVRTHIALKQARDRETALRKELEASLAEIKQLSGLLPICATCKKIRDEQGGWNPLEVYISEHSEADFTHGICPDCSKAMLAEARRARNT
jgi:CheY-like chemotaxis protein